MSRYKRRTALETAATLASGVTGVTVDAVVPVKVSLTAAQAATAVANGVHAAVTDTGSPQTITTGITNPPYPRNITATAGGTAGDIKAVQVVVTGTNYLDAVITETLPAFTVDTAGIVSGAKAFKTVTSYALPAHDGTGATTALGFGDILGLPFLLQDGNSVLLATLAGVKEATPPTVVADVDEVEKNTVDLSSALNGTAVTITLLV